MIVVLRRAFLSSLSSSLCEGFFFFGGLSSSSSSGSEGIMERAGLGRDIGVERFDFVEGQREPPV